MVRVFIAGPYSDIRHNGSIENNMLAARAATETLLKRGFAVYCPHTMYYTLEDAIPYEQFLLTTCDWLQSCDAVYVLPGSETSPGAQREIREARALGKEVWHEIPPSMPINDDSWE